MGAVESRWGNRFCGGALMSTGDTRDGCDWWWASWHHLERAEGVAPTMEDAIYALEHHLAGRRSAGRHVARLAEQIDTVLDASARAPVRGAV